MKPFVAHPVAASTRITSRFGTRTHPISGEKKFHSGVDFSAADGTTLVACDDGVVSFVFTDANNPSGLAVGMKRADGVAWSYSHMSRVDVRAGQKLLAGATVGLSGHTGMSNGKPSVTGPHLHFVVRAPNGDAVDPMTFLGAGGGGGKLIGVFLAAAAAAAAFG